MSRRSIGGSRVQRLVQNDRPRRDLRGDRYTLRLESARPSRSRTIGQPHDLDGKREVRTSCAHDLQLLVVLLAEERPARPRGVEQLGDHRGHAVEVTGADRAFHACR